MRIVRLDTENIKRIKALTIEPGPDGLIVIAGRNGQGKSSALDSIAYALGGKDLMPPEPIRRGESEGRVRVDLGDFVVERVFRREPAGCDCGAAVDKDDHLAECTSNKAWGPTKSTLTVKGKEIAPGIAPKYPSPQAMLDTMIGKLAFDPIEFMSMNPAAQAEQLRRIAKLDFAVLNSKRAALFAARTEAKRAAASARTIADAMVIYEGVSAEETPADAIAKRLTEARGLMEVAEARDRAASHANSKVQGCEASIKGLEDSISQLQRQLEQKVQALTLEQQERARWRQDAKAAEQAAAEARAAVPDTGVVEAELKAIEQHNRKVRENIAASDADAKAIELEGRVDVLNIEIEGIDAQKARALKEAQFPVPGLGLSDDTTAVTFNGLPLEQASQAEQLRVSVAIGAALNPSLQVLLVRQGSLLDSSGMTALAALAAEANVQVWVERVSDGDGPATVVIEDGEAKA
jgi:hypothetical protein